jgi:hypothetical protein
MPGSPAQAADRLVQCTIRTAIREPSCKGTGNITLVQQQNQSTGPLALTSLPQLLVQLPVGKRGALSLQ